MEKRNLGSPSPETSRLRGCPASLALPDAQAYGNITSNFPDRPHKSNVRTYARTALLSVTSVSSSGTDASVPTSIPSNQEVESHRRIRKRPRFEILGMSLNT